MKNRGMAIWMIAGALLLSAPAFSQSTGRGRAVVTILSKQHGESPASVSQQAVSIKVNGKESTVTSWTPLRGPEARLARLTPGGKRYGMANQTEGSSFEAAARWVADVAITLPAHIHAVTRSRQLCAQALGYTLPTYMSFGLLALMDKGLAATKKIAFRTGLQGLVALVHGTSRTDKEWPLTHWRELGARLNAAGFMVALPHGSAAEEAVCQAIAQDLPHAQVWPRLALDALTDSLAHCDGVIGVDSGLSHIAVALDLPHVQIYNFDTAWRTGPLAEQQAILGASVPRQVSVFAQPTPSVDAVWQAWELVLEASLEVKARPIRGRPSGFANL